MEKETDIRFRELRIEKGLTQKQVADYLHINHNTYSQYERGRNQFPLYLVKKLAVLYDTSIDYLAGITDVRTPHKRKKETHGNP